MPKERVMKSARDGYADLLVQWGRDELLAEDRPLVRLFIAPSEGLGALRGFFAFHPEDPESIGLKPGESVGPIDIRVDRAQINRLIRVLRRARDATFGRDE